MKEIITVRTTNKKNVAIAQITMRISPILISFILRQLK